MSGPGNGTQETYLGEGVFASWDGTKVILRMAVIGGDHFVYLDPTVYAGLVRFAQTVLPPNWAC
jgi:hypothetical protein